MSYLSLILAHECHRTYDGVDTTKGGKRSGFRVQGLSAGITVYQLSMAKADALSADILLEIPESAITVKAKAKDQIVFVDAALESFSVRFDNKVRSRKYDEVAPNDVHVDSDAVIAAFIGAGYGQRYSFGNNEHISNVLVWQKDLEHVYLVLFSLPVFCDIIGSANFYNDYDFTDNDLGKAARRGFGLGVRCFSYGRDDNAKLPIKLLYSDRHVAYVYTDQSEAGLSVADLTQAMTELGPIFVHRSYNSNSNRDSICRAINSRGGLFLFSALFHIVPVAEAVTVELKPKLLSKAALASLKLGRRFQNSESYYQACIGDGGRTAIVFDPVLAKLLNRDLAAASSRIVGAGYYPGIDYNRKAWYQVSPALYPLLGMDVFLGQAVLLMFKTVWLELQHQHQKRITAGMALLLRVSPCATIQDNIENHIPVLLTEITTAIFMLGKNSSISDAQPAYVRGGTDDDGYMRNGYIVVSRLMRRLAASYELAILAAGGANNSVSLGHAQRTHNSVLDILAAMSLMIGVDKATPIMRKQLQPLVPMLRTVADLNASGKVKPKLNLVKPLPRNLELTQVLKVNAAFVDLVITAAAEVGCTGITGPYKAVARASLDGITF